MWSSAAACPGNATLTLVDMKLAMKATFLYEQQRLSNIIQRTFSLSPDNTADNSEVKTHERMFSFTPHPRNAFTVVGNFLMHNKYTAAAALCRCVRQRRKEEPKKGGGWRVNISGRRVCGDLNGELQRAKPRQDAGKQLIQCLFHFYANERRPKAAK